MIRYEFYEPNDGTTTDATIAHFGVKGMKWGVRKDRVKAAGRKFTSNVKEGGRKTGELAKAVGRKGKAGLKKSDAYLEKNPMAAVGLSLATGLVAGKVLRKANLTMNPTMPKFDDPAYFSSYSKNYTKSGQTTAQKAAALGYTGKAFPDKMVKAQPELAGRTYYEKKR